MKLTSAQVAVPLLASTAQAIFGGKAPPKPTPNLVDGFVWTDPFASDAIAAFESTCETTRVFNALEYTLHDLMKQPPEGLWTWASGLKKFFAGREYPGGWSGYDRHLHDRGVLLMDYDKVPLDLRLWIEEEDRSGGDGKGLFAVFEKPKLEGDTFEDVVKFPTASDVDRSKDGEKVAIFAPGAIYHVLPLWVAEDSQCKGKLLAFSVPTVQMC